MHVMLVLHMYTSLFLYRIGVYEFYYAQRILCSIIYYTQFTHLLLLRVMYDPQRTILYVIFLARVCKVT